MFMIFVTSCQHPSDIQAVIKFSHLSTKSSSFHKLEFMHHQEISTSTNYLELLTGFLLTEPFLTMQLTQILWMHFIKSNLHSLHFSYICSKHSKLPNFNAIIISTQLQVWYVLLDSFSVICNLSSSN